MSILRQRAENYVAMRRTLGFTMDTQAQLLNSFVGYAEQAGATTVTTDLAVAWARLPVNAQPIRWNHRLATVRGFAVHLRTLDPATEVPPADLLPARQNRITPYLYSPGEITALMDAADALTPPLRAALYRTLIGLLTVTGMRPGEATRLDRGDVDVDIGLITIVGSKLGKSRQVPLHPSTVTALRDYIDIRDRRFPVPRSPSFLVTSIGSRPHRVTLQRGFADLVEEVGLQPTLGGRRARLHDMRHTLAVTTMRTWYLAGADVQARLPVLSTFLGHVNPKSTYYYLHAAPELLALAADRLERPHGDAS
jgi:integrase/recombinase XerD